MNGGMRAAAAIAVGYVLGRRKKFRTATLMAAATAVGGTTVGGLALRRGVKMLGSSEALGKVAPQLGEIVDTVRGDLLDAGKAAAAAAVTNRLDTLTDSIHERADRVRNPEAFVEEGVGQAAETGRAAGRAGRQAASGAGGAARRLGRGAPRSRDEEDYESGEADEADYEPDDYEENGEQAGEPDDLQEDDEADEAPARRAATRRRSPVTRARR
jgi:hypothetical protein